MDNKYTDKENYVTRDPHPDAWRNHPNGCIINHYKECIQGRVIDVGCNHGSCTFLLAENETVTDVVGYDMNWEALMVGCQTADQIGDKKTTFLVGDCRYIPYQDGHFDTLTSFHMLEHIYPEDVDQVVREFHRIIKVGSYVIISIPYDKAYPSEQHVAYYVESTLTALFEKHGFETILCERQNWTEANLLTGIFRKL